MYASLMQLRVSPSPSLERLRSLDSRTNLQPVSRLDVVPDGAVDMTDARSLERLARAARRLAPNVAEPSAISQSRAGQHNLFGGVELGPRGGLRPGSLNQPQLRDLATELDWAAQQARVAVAARATGQTPSDTVHNIFAADGKRIAQSSAAADVVEGIRQLDVKPLEQAGVKPVATFDLDGTSMQGDIMLPMVRLMAQKQMFGGDANDVFRTLLRTRDVDQRAVEGNDGNANALLMLDTVQPIEKGTREAISIPEAFYATAAALKGQKLDSLEATARELMEKGPHGGIPYRDNVNDTSRAAGDGVRDVVAALEDRGVEPWLVSHGFDWLARTAAPYMGVDSRNVLASRSVVKDGQLTGELVFQPSKATSIKQAIGSPPTVAFGDTGSDLSMLDIATVRGMIVNPSKRMKAENQDRGNTLGTVDYPGTEGEYRDRA